ncbi:AI-2E family transporter [Pilimelia anulata]|uniref:AI-2E family transporter n=1 Tax=Pilimelia anulata TaxID=53371 RepID=A0A8J3B8W8_9ACTN|nr:AI-2E family transporter [Pilimelia anulata]GGK02860.1 AI-2E family transporter [Pilimelia anulata]
MRTPDSRSPAGITLTVIGLVLLTTATLTVAHAVQRVLVWLVIAIFLATAIAPAVDLLERRVRRCPRWLATLVVFLGATVLVAGVVTAFAIPLGRELAQLAERVPDLVRDTRAGRGPLAGLIERFRVREYLATHGDQVRQYLTSLGTPTLSLLRGAANTVVGAVTVVVLTYVVVLQAPRIVAGLLGLFRPDRSARVADVGRRCARTVTGYLTGNLVISAVCGGLTYVTLLLLGVPYAGLLALFVALMDLIPLVGATIGAVVAVLVGFTESTLAGVVLIAFFVVYQQLENHLLQPVVFARTVQLSPLAVLIAILIAVELAGILGALLAIPVAGIVKVLWGELRPALVDGPPDGAAAGGPDAAGPGPAAGGPGSAGSTDAPAAG